MSSLYFKNLSLPSSVNRQFDPNLGSVQRQLLESFRFAEKSFETINLDKVFFVKEKAEIDVMNALKSMSSNND